ncbi:MAG: hypothetical protein HOV83_12820, partial [Catenulispora sp.]|nr:hypothetical protein [Catenulispora sp.]
AGMPQTPLATTIADVRAWDRERGEPPLESGFGVEQEAEVLVRYAAGESGSGV